VKKIRILITGGTIDNIDYEKAEDAPEGAKSVIPALLEQINIEASVETEVVCFKDGRFITQEDQKVIRKRIEESEERLFIITHGTTTMSGTAKYLGSKISTKTIVLTGAMVMPKEGDSDTIPNLEFAFSQVQVLDSGVYIAMNGRIFTWDNVRKNENKGCFEEER
jgi:L-asparaginase